MTVKLPRLSLTLIFFRLNLRAFLISTRFFVGVWSKSTCTFLFPVMKSEVSVFALIKSSYAQLKINSPPKSPAPGPISTTQSEAFINSSLCSTTMIVFPMVWSFLMAVMAFLISQVSSPIVGSSKT